MLTALEHPLVRALHQAAAQNPQTTAVVDETSSSMSYESVQNEAALLAEQLKAAGVGSGHLVVLYATDTVQHVVALLGVTMAGAAFLVLDQNTPASRAAQIIDNTNPSLVSSGTSIRRDVGDLVRPASAGMHRLPRSEYVNAAYVVYTSGSTGTPKGVILPRAGLDNLIEEQRRLFALRPSDRVLQWAPWTFDAAIFDVAMAMGAGATLVLRNRVTKLPGDSLSQTLVQDSISALTVTPTALAATSVRGDCAQLQTIICAGESVPPAIVKDWAAENRRLFNAYGPAEATIWSTLKVLHGPDDARSAGHAIRNVTIGVHDAAGQPLASGDAGEVWIGGPGVALGYIGGTDSDHARFVTEGVADGHGENAHGVRRLYRTGDSGRINADGELELLGRLDRQIKLHGVRIELREIEATLLHRAETAAAAAVLVGEAVSARIVCFVVVNGRSPVDGRDLRAWLATQLPGYYVPSEVRIVDHLPLSGNGKTDYAALKVLAAQLPATAASGAACEAQVQDGDTTVASRLMTIWEDVLAISAVGLDDDLFDIGGNSMRATRMMVRIRAEFQVELDIRQLYRARTIRKVSHLIRELTSGR